MKEMLHRVLMSADRVLVDEEAEWDDVEVDVKISPELGQMMERLYNAQRKKRHMDFSIYLKDDAVLKTNSLFACTLFDVVQTKLSSKGVKEDHKIFFVMPDEELSELQALIGLVCGQITRMKKSLLHRLLAIARKYLMPEFLFYPLVGGELRRTLKQIAELEKVRKKVKNELWEERLKQYFEVQPEKAQPRLYGYSIEKMPNAGDVQIGKHFCRMGRLWTSHEWHAVLVVSMVENGKVFVRYGGHVKEVDISSLRFLLDFDGIQPCTVFPAAIMMGDAYYSVDRVIRKPIEFIGDDVHNYADKIGHFCVRTQRMGDESDTVLFLGVRDNYSIYALQNGQVVHIQVIGTTRDWVLVDSIDPCFVTPLYLDLTARILRAHSLPHYEIELDPDGDAEFHEERYYGCFLNEIGTRLTQYRLVTLLKAATPFDPLAHVLSYDKYPCMYRVPMDSLHWVAPVDD
jgi:hypothetical protein